MSRKPLLTLVALPAASVLAALGITACGNGSTNDATVVQAAATPQFLTESADRTAAIESGRYELTIDIPASSDVPKPFSITGSGAFDLANQRSQMSFDLGGLIDVAKASDSADSLALLGDGKFEVITDGDAVYIHAGFLSAFLGGDDAKPWIKIPADKGGGQITDQLSSGLADATSLLDLLRDNGATVTDEGQADVQGQSTHHFNATISVAAALAAAPADSKAKAQAFIDQLGAKAGDAEIPVDVFVDDQGFVRRMQMTFDGDLYSSLVGGDAAPPSAGGMTFTLDFLDLGKSVDIQPPPADQVGDASGLAKMFQDAQPQGD